MSRKDSLPETRQSIKFLPVRNFVEREEGITIKRPLLPKISIVDHIPELPERPISEKKTFILLAFSTLCSALVGPLLLAINASLMLKLFWRQLIVTAMFFGSLYFIPQNEKIKMRSHIKRIPRYLKGSLWYFLTMLFFGMAVNNTTLGNAYILSNMDLLSLIILRRIYVNSKFSRHEKIGIFTAFACILLCFLDHVSFGNLYGLISSFSACFFLVWSEEKADNKSWKTFSIINLFSTILLAILAFFLEGAEISLNVEKGLFGVFTIRMFLIHLGIAVITGLGSSALHFKLSKGLTDFEHKFSASFQAPIASITGSLTSLTGIPTIYMWISILISFFSSWFLCQGKQEGEWDDAERLFQELGNIDSHSSSASYTPLTL